jgi:hypothetical protein
MRIAGIHAGTRRDGIATVVVEFVLILVGLITSIMIGAFFFDLFGTYLSPAEVAAQASSCSSDGLSEVCQFTLSNVGAHSVATSSGCSLSNVSGNLTGGGTIPGGGSLNHVSCEVQGVHAAAGSRLTGAISLSNGAIVFFAGTAS